LLNTLFQDTAHVESRIFAICLAEWGGRLVVGGANESYHTGPVQWTGLEIWSYRVQLSSMAIAGKTLSTSYRRTVIDSGTTFTYMATGPYHALRDGIESFCRRHNSCGAQRSGTCWNVPDLYKGLERFPVVDVYFGSVKTTWDARAYMHRKHTSTQWCYSFEDDGASAGTTLGASWMKYKEVVFDLHRQKVGIAPANCPEFRERPNHPGVVRETPTASPSTTSPASFSSTLPTKGTSTSLAADRTTPTPSAVGTTPQAPRKSRRSILPGKITLIMIGVASVALGCVVTSGLCVAWHLNRGRGVRHLALEETGEPAVPAVTIGPETFQIGDDDDDDLGFDVVQNVDEEELHRHTSGGPLE